MEIASLKLINFRNFENLELNFSKNRNIIIEDNSLAILVSIIKVIVDESLLVKYLIKSEINTSFIKSSKILLITCGSIFSLEK